MDNRIIHQKTANIEFVAFCCSTFRYVYETLNFSPEVQTLNPVSTENADACNFHSCERYKKGFRHHVYKLPSKPTCDEFAS
jgi:hypothetical protein